MRRHEKTYKKKDGNNKRNKERRKERELPTSNHDGVCLDEGGKLKRCEKGTV